ncbi:MAG TPA: hypothetical protein VJV97_08825 [Gemmatimonadaceae bacterium]|nr:hypothetical protein [Gemmatimonadaceae bacterium]
MSIPFGAMPADRQLATLGCGVAAIILGATTPRVAALVNGRTLFVSVSPMPWWFSALFAALALAVAVRVTGWVLRIALVAFAVNRVLSIASVAHALSIGPVTVTALNELFGCSLMVAAWPHAGRRARIAAVVLFACFAALAIWLGSGRSSVIASVYAAAA